LELELDLGVESWELGEMLWEGGCRGSLLVCWLCCGRLE
jgi:hypothetical protein